MDQHIRAEIAAELDVCNDRLLMAAAAEPLDALHTLRLLAYGQAAQLRALAVALEPDRVRRENPDQMTFPWMSDTSPAEEAG